MEENKIEEKIASLLFGLLDKCIDKSELENFHNLDQQILKSLENASTEARSINSLLESIQNKNIQDSNGKEFIDQMIAQTVKNTDSIIEINEILSDIQPKTLEKSFFSNSAYNSVKITEVSYLNKGIYRILIENLENTKKRNLSLVLDVGNSLIPVYSLPDINNYSTIEIKAAIPSETLISKPIQPSDSIEVNNSPYKYILKSPPVLLKIIDQNKVINSFEMYPIVINELIATENENIYQISYKNNTSLFLNCIAINETQKTSLHRVVLGPNKETTLIIKKNKNDIVFVSANGKSLSKAVS